VKKLEEQVAKAGDDALRLGKELGRSRSIRLVWECADAAGKEVRIE
jgi:hypothetical protein